MLSSWRLYSWMRFTCTSNSESTLHVDAGAPVHLLRQRNLVGALDLAEQRAEARIVRRPAQPLDFLEIVLPALPSRSVSSRDSRGFDCFSQRRTVMPLVTLVKRSGKHLREAREDSLLHQLGMQLRDAVDLVAADHRQVRHAHAPPVRSRR